jgi:hypothetical protein
MPQTARIDPVRVLVEDLDAGAHGPGATPRTIYPALPVKATGPNGGLAQKTRPQWPPPVNSRSKEQAYGSFRGFRPDARVRLDRPTSYQLHDQKDNHDNEENVNQSTPHWEYSPP